MPPLEGSTEGAQFREVLLDVEEQLQQRSVRLPPVPHGVELAERLRLPRVGPQVVLGAVRVDEGEEPAKPAAPRMVRVHQAVQA
ncbi:MAG TPA: hypothetical protein VNK04_23070, partial [Gemmataceae bacterium]|nr:hypothetical protein [Gemmataceae bacterium]